VNFLMRKGTSFFWQKNVVAFFALTLLEDVSYEEN